MPKTEKSGSHFALLALAVSLTLFALGTPLTKWLNMNGKSLGFEGADAISFCNILFAGNICAAMVVAFWFGFLKLFFELRHLGVKAWLILLLASGLSVAIPALMFTALDSTSVANVVLLGRVGPLLYAVIGSLVLAEQLTKWDWLGNTFVFASILVLVWAQGDFHLVRGDLLALLSGVFYCATIIAGRYAVKVATTPAYMIVRNLLSALIFLIIAVTLYGWVHFVDLIHPRLWGVVAVYALIAVVAAQFAWYYALARVRSVQVGSFSIVSPAMGIFFAFLLLGEAPIMAQWIALGLTSVGILISSFDKLRFVPRTSPETSLAAN